MTVKGQIISGDFSRIIARQKTDTPVQLGELLINETSSAKILLQAIDLSYGSQISQQNLELISGMHVEDDQPINLYDEKLRNYPLIHLKSLLSISKTDARLAKSLPDCFGTIRQITKEDMSFLPKHQDALTLGKMRSGSTEIDVDISLPLRKVLSHHILIPATTGKGKSNLMSTILWNTLTSTDCAMLVFDPHDEYYGRNTLGLKDHPKYNTLASYYTPSNIPPGGYSLTINVELLQPKHFSGVTDFSFPQQELLAVYYNQFKEKWVESLLTKQHIKFDFNEATFAVVHRRLCRLLDISVSDNGISCHGLFSQTAGKAFFTDIVSQIEQSKTVIIDTSSLTGDAELLIASLISSAVFDKYRYYRKQGTLAHKPIVSIVLEEAPRVIGKEVLEKGANVFGTIAKEGRKFQVGLCAITQLPSLIPKEILANMNTKIILGIEMATERSAIIESAAQDLSDDSRSIASLDKGEAIITSNFARFAIPIKIPLFETLVKSVKVEKKKLVGL